MRESRYYQKANPEKIWESSRKNNRDEFRPHKAEQGRGETKDEVCIGGGENDKRCTEERTENPGINSGWGKRWEQILNPAEVSDVEETSGESALPQQHIRGAWMGERKKNRKQPVHSL